MVNFESVWWVMANLCFFQNLFFLNLFLFWQSAVLNLLKNGSWIDDWMFSRAEVSHNILLWRESQVLAAWNGRVFDFGYKAISGINLLMNFYCFLLQKKKPTDDCVKISWFHEVVDDLANFFPHYHFYCIPLSNDEFISHPAVLINVLGLMKWAIFVDPADSFF